MQTTKELTKELISEIEKYYSHNAIIGDDNLHLVDNVIDELNLHDSLYQRIYDMFVMNDGLMYPPTFL